MVDEQNAVVSVFDHGLLYGDGVFEGIRAYNGRVFKLTEHIARLYYSAKAIALTIPMTQEEMIKAVVETCKVNNLRDCYIRLVVTRGVGTLGLSPKKCGTPQVIIIAAGIQLYPEEYYTKGMSIVTVPTTRNHHNAVNPAIKSLNYLNNILAKIEANTAGVEEAIMLNSQGYVAECTGDNIFLIKGKQLITPPLTTWHQDAERIGKESVRKLIEAIEHRDTCVAEQIMVSGELISGYSVRKWG